MTKCWGLGFLIAKLPQIPHSSDCTGYVWRSKIRPVKDRIWNQTRGREAQLIYKAMSESSVAVSTPSAFPAKGLSGPRGNLFFSSNTQHYGPFRTPQQSLWTIWTFMVQLSAHVGIQCKYKALSWGGGMLDHTTSNLVPVICSSVSLLCAACFMVCMRWINAINLILGSQETTAQISSYVHPGAAGASGCHSWIPVCLWATP